MKILLVTSAAPKSAPFSTAEKRAPLGIGYLISVLRDDGHDVSFIDNYLVPSSFLETGYLQKNKIDFIGIYANTICYQDTLRMLDSIKSLRDMGNWNGKIIIGGPHTSVALDTIPDFVDYVVQGEGEESIIDIVNGKAQSRVIRKQRITKMDNLPFPAWDYFASLPYDYSTIWSDTEPFFTMNTSRGCPFNCSFCSVGSIWGRKYTMYSANRIIEEIKYLKRNFSAKGIYFREDNFTLSVSRVKAFCKLLIKNELYVEWICETRVDNLSYSLLETMKNSGCIGLYIGVESGSTKILDLVNKGISIDQIKKVFRWCKQLNIQTYASLIFGIPGETFEDLELTNKLINEISPDHVGKGIFVGIPNSSLYKYVKKNKLYDYEDSLGLLYLPGYNKRVDRYYNGNKSFKIEHESEDWIDYKYEEQKQKKRIENRLNKRIKKWKKDKTRLIIYGAGKQMVDLVKTFSFQDVNIVAFIDKDPRKKGKKILKSFILSPDDISNLKFDEIFLSLTKPTEIVYSELKARELKTPITKLYRSNEFFLLNI